VRKAPRLSMRPVAMKARSKSKTIFPNPISAVSNLIRRKSKKAPGAPQQQSFSIQAREMKPVSSHSPGITQDKVHELISLQSFDGSWEWKYDLFKIMDLQPEDVKAKLDWDAIFGKQDAGNKTDDQQQRVVATFVVVSYLHTKCSGRKETWELLCDKAVNWATKKIGEMGGPTGRSLDEWFKIFDKIFS
jgi:hypothetical protein